MIDLQTFLNRYIFFVCVCVSVVGTGGFDVFIDLEEEGTSPDDTKSSLTNNDGLSKLISTHYTSHFLSCFSSSFVNSFLFDCHPGLYCFHVHTYL